VDAIAHAAALAIATGAFAAAAADAPPRLDAGNWRVRVTSITNGVADPAQDFEIVAAAGEGDLMGPCKAP